MTARRTLLMALAPIAFAALPANADAQKRQRDRITREEIMASTQKDLDLYQVIRSIRPQFLEAPKGVRTLGNSFIYPVVVYIDGKKDTGLDALRLMSALDVEEVRYLEPNRSESEFGPSANGGAIVVKRFKGPKPIAAQLADTTKPKPPRER